MLSIDVKPSNLGDLDSTQCCFVLMTRWIYSCDQALMKLWTQGRKDFKVEKVVYIFYKFFKFLLNLHISPLLQTLQPHVPLC